MSYVIVSSNKKGSAVAEFTSMASAVSIVNWFLRMIFFVSFYLNLQCERPNNSDMVSRFLNYLRNLQ